MKSWQDRIRRWHDFVFDEWDKTLGPRIYSMRLLEEALELAQAEKIALREIGHIIDQVYRKPPGDPTKEFGGVLVTATGYTNQAGLDMEATFEAEFARIQDPALIERIRFRNYRGDKIGLRPQDRK